MPSKQLRYIIYLHELVLLVLYYDILLAYKGVLNCGYPKWMVYKGKSIYKWMRTGGTPISGNLHMMYHIFGWISRPHVPQKTGHWDGNWIRGNIPPLAV